MHARSRGGAAVGRRVQVAIGALALAGLTGAGVAGCGAGDGGGASAPSTAVRPTSPTSSASSTGPTGSVSPSSPGASASPSASPTDGPVYLALGDSLAAGFQPDRGDDPATSYAARVEAGLAAAAPSGEQPTMVNLGCSGETVGSMIEGSRCTYPQGSQLQAAEALLRERRGEVAAVTLDIGGNDVLRCARVRLDETCFTQGAGVVADRLPEVLRRVRAAAGPDTRIAVLTYYNPFLATQPTEQGELLRRQSEPALRALNTTIARVARAHGATVVDTAALMPTGASVCDLTWRCTRFDIHLTDEGARRVGDRILAAWDVPIP